VLDREVIRHQLVSRRTFILTSGKVGILSALLGRMLYLQLIKGNEYQILSDKNRISLVITPPERGLIEDRNGFVISENRPSYFLKLDRRQSTTYKESLANLFELLKLDDDAKRSIFAKLKRTSYRTPVNLAQDISWENVALIEERIHDLSGIYIEATSLRKYNFPEIYSHITGYVGKISEAEQQELGQSANEFQMGKTGIEKQYEEVLQGELGYRKIEVDAHGLYINELEKVDSIKGNSINLNIDDNCQQHLHSVMNPIGSSAIVMDVSNGEVIASCSMPVFNPNEFVGGISSANWKKLMNDPYKPLINKVVQTQYPPGSNFKLITVLAALEAGILPTQKFFCSGSVAIGSRDFHCWHLSGHGELDMIDSIKHSCNCYMFNLGKLIGGDRILAVARRFGYGSLTGVDLPGEQKGFVPDREWKLKNFKFDWSLGDTFNIAIGQGALLSTPIQQVRMVAAFANGGKLLRPRFAQSCEQESIEISIKTEHLAIIREGMFRAVNIEGGTAFRSKANNTILAGKTGTSQVQAKKNAHDDLSRDSVRWQSRNHALFVGFVPFDNPIYAVSVIVDHGGGGAKSAAPIAKEICDHLF